MSFESFATAPLARRLPYELIDGRLYVSPLPNLPHDDLLEWIQRGASHLLRGRPEVIDRISTHGRVFVPGRPPSTCPEPDLAAYHDYPYHAPGGAEMARHQPHPGRRSRI